MTEQKKELSPAEATHQEYNHLIGLIGHNKAQQLMLKLEEDRLHNRIIKTMQKAQNLPKEELKAAYEKIEKEQINEQPPAEAIG